jgi:hypothetical protein
MESSTHNIPADPQPQKQIATEFATWPMTDAGVKNANEIRGKFDALLDHIALVTPPGNARYLALVKTKLEEACMFAVKGISKPTN